MANYTLPYTGEEVKGLLAKIDEQEKKIEEQETEISTLRDSISQTANSVSYSKILWENYAYMQANQTAELSEPVSQQPHGIVLAWSGYDGEPKNYDWNYFFVPKYHVDKSNDNGAGVSCFLVNSTASCLCTKYVYIYDSKIVGNENNNIEDSSVLNSGIKRSNRHYVLRYVIGV